MGIVLYACMILYGMLLFEEYPCTDNTRRSHFGSSSRGTFCSELCLSFVSMSVRDAPHQLIAHLHGDLLFTCVHWQGLGQTEAATR